MHITLIIIVIKNVTNKHWDRYVILERGAIAENNKIDHTWVKKEIFGIILGIG